MNEAAERVLVTLPSEYEIEYEYAKGKKFHKTDMEAARRVQGAVSRAVSRTAVVLHWGRKVVPSRVVCLWDEPTWEELVEIIGSSDLTIADRVQKLIESKKCDLEY